LADRKTQTRRLLRPQPQRMCSHVEPFRGEGVGWVAGDNRGRVFPCPHGVPGDRLWVREGWARWADTKSHECIVYRAGGAPRSILATEEGEGDPVALGGAAVPMVGEIPRWRPSIHMPRWASRLTLELVSVRAERLQDISEKDARAEGAYGALRDSEQELDAWARWTKQVDPRALAATMRGAFALLWERINGHRPGARWEDNPWVWVLGLKRLEVARAA